MSFAAADCAPFCTMSQNASPWAECVTMAILRRGPPLPLRALVACSSAFFPPELLHALSASSPARAAAITFRFISVGLLSGARQPACGPAAGGVRDSAPPVDEPAQAISVRLRGVHR